MANFEILHKTTGNTYYYRMVRIPDGYIWNNVLSVWAASVSLADSKITVTENAATGDYPLEIPSALTGSTRINLIVYVAADDSVAYGKEISYGSIFGF